MEALAETRAEGERGRDLGLNVQRAGSGGRAQFGHRSPNKWGLRS
jgi:hypothetical protein